VTSPADLSLSGLLSALENRKVSCAEALEAALARGEAWSRLNLYISETDQAELKASAAREDARRAAGDAGALSGAPYAVKDLIAAAGLPFTLGSPAFANVTPTEDAACVAAMTAQGAVMTGKLNLHELAFGITGNNAYYGAVGCPYDTSRVAGGSSSASAAAVAVGAAAFSLGTDTGGSGRIPAAFCGVVGFRPTTGRYPSAGSMTLSKTRDTIALFTKRVADAAVLDSLLAGAPPQGMVSLKGARIGVPRAPFFEDLDPGVAAAVEASLMRLADAGAVLIEAPMTQMAELDELCGMAIAAYETVEAFRSYTPQVLGRPFEDVVDQIASPDVRGIFTEALGPGGVPEAVYLQALNDVRPRLVRAYADWYAENNLAAAVLPTTPLPAPPIGDDETTALNGRQVPTFPAVTRMTRANSVAGQPALSIPCGLTPDGLPVGLQIEGPSGADGALLALAAAIEAVLDPIPSPS